MTEQSRDTRTWYLDRDPLSVVDRSLIDYIHAHAGREILDLGCGPGGYSKVLQDLGHSMKALDINPEYVDIARGLGVDANVCDGRILPMPDASVDTIILVEVLEHIPQAEGLMQELARVARRNVIATVPNCTRNFKAPVVLSHMLDVDHKNFHTTETLKALLSTAFEDVKVIQVAPFDIQLARDLLPRWAFLLFRAAMKLHLLRPRFHFRLIANACK